MIRAQTLRRPRHSSRGASILPRGVGDSLRAIDVRIGSFCVDRSEQALFTPLPRYGAKQEEVVLALNLVEFRQEERSGRKRARVSRKQESFCEAA